LFGGAGDLDLFSQALQQLSDTNKKVNNTKIVNIIKIDCRDIIA
jgi:hypothetical protein